MNPLFQHKQSQAMITARNRAVMYNEHRASEVNTEGTFSKSEDSYSALHRPKQEDIIIKAKGEGSRGGKVIGHTKSGKPIYHSNDFLSGFNHKEAHKDFTSADHAEAAKLHGSESSRLKKEANAGGADAEAKWSEATAHELWAKEHKELGKQKESSSDTIPAPKGLTSHAIAAYNDVAAGMSSEDFYKKHPVGDYDSYKETAEKNGNKKMVGAESDEKTKHGEELKTGDDVVVNPDHPTVQKHGKVVESYGTNGVKVDDGSGQHAVYNRSDVKSKAKHEADYHGKELGKTSSGKTVYNHSDHDAHKDFTAQDHLEAANLHIKARNGVKKTVNEHAAGDKAEVVRQMSSNPHIQHHDKHLQEHLNKYADELKKGEEIHGINVDTDVLNDMLQKGEISDALVSGYGAGSEPMKFTKTGKELKEKIPAALATLEGEKIKIESQLAAYKQAAGVEPDRETSRRFNRKASYFRYEYKMCEPEYLGNSQYAPKTEQMDCCSKYNNLLSILLDVEDDIDALNIMQTNLEDSKKYTLSVSQLIALNFK